MIEARPCRTAWFSSIPSMILASSTKSVCAFVASLPGGVGLGSTAGSTSNHPRFPPRVFSLLDTRRRALYFRRSMKQILPKLLVPTLAMALAACATTDGGNSTPAPAPGAMTKVHRLTIGRVAPVPLSNAEADRILAGATRVLRSRDSGSDVSADVILQRNGDVRVIPGPAVITSDADRARIGASGVQVAIVEAVRFCTAMKPGILGCAPIGGRYMVLVRQNSLEDIIWAHEFGHNCGLNHRNDSSALMYTEAGSSRRSLNDAEARSYERKGAGSGSAAIMADAGGSAEAQPPETAGEFLNRSYIHGIPYSHVARFGPADAANFKAILADPARKAQWLNASVALGAIGTAEAVEGVRAFVCKGRGRLDHASYQAKLAGLVSLGYGAARHPRGDALERLAKSTSVDAWTKELRWNAPGRTAGAETARMLTAASYSGLALSGENEAAKVLADEARKIRDDAPLRKVAETAITELRKVRAQGLRRYSEPHRNAEP